MICNQNECTGCGACAAICPQNCIEIKLNDNGILYPSMNQEKCIQCQKCSRICPSLHEVQRAERIMPSVYLSHANDNEILQLSASGGVATAIGKFFVTDYDGYACGVNFTDDFTVKFDITNDIDQLKSFAGSKYVQSDMNHIFHKIKENLENQQAVFFSGLPCQVAALHSYLGKEYDKLITADIVCHGTASSTLFQDYISYTEQKKKSKLVSIGHTDKKDGWSIMIQRTIKFETEDGKVTYLSSAKDSYVFCFLSNLFFKPSCYQCKYAKIPRIGDLTLGDFFGIGTLRPAKNLNPMGESMIMVNTKKGQHLLDAMSEQLYLDKRELEEALYFNHNLWKPSGKHRDYDSFQYDMTQLSYSQLADKYFYKNAKSRLNRLVRAALKKLLGMRLVCKCILLSNRIHGTTKKADAIIKQCKEMYHEN